MKLQEVPEGTLFVLDEKQQGDPAKANVYMRASGIPNYPTSVAQIIHYPDDPSMCGAGAFPGNVALHTDIYPIGLEKLDGVVSPEVFAELKTAVPAA